ncbi:hypothetical protein M011DRAFT_471836 [Sporormia fimetaria CBS 119925]|uniref:Uncharacterized protein n=1 Tax=Sporormia fimetaria CBS 119925 TaxID=1340428 RepID=A0A6A6UZI5_9PLEO|nr:hypothetical protein M011DRAFT_471836 [Sporormia fimetaria CBS 119925]
MHVHIYGLQIVQYYIFQAMFTITGFYLGTLTDFPGVISKNYHLSNRRIQQAGNIAAVTGYGADALVQINLAD